jgi:hypothetical protein
MSLTIERFITRCQIPRRLKLDGALVDRVAREQFPSECARQLGPRWPRHASVYRIRRLPVRLTVFLADLNDTRLPQLWAAAFVRAIAETLALPAGSGPVEVVRAENWAEWLARFIHDLLNGNASGRWEYQEFQEYFGLSTKDALLAILSQQPAEIISVLVALEARSALDRLLTVLDELALEQLFVAIAREMGVEQSRLSITDLLTVGRLLLSQSALRPGVVPTSRRHALRLFLALRRETTLKPGDTWSPRRVLHGLMSLATLTQLIRSVEGTEANCDVLAAALSEHIKEPLHPVVLEVLEEIRNLVQTKRQNSRHKARVSSMLTELTHLVIELQPLFSTPGNQAHDIRWISSDCAGLFLLIGLIKKLGWSESILQSALGSAYGPRAVTYIFAGLSLSVLARFVDDPDRLDPGLALFAGCPGDPDLAGLRRFFASGSAADRREILTELIGETKGPNDASEVWAATLDCLAEQLIREFALRVRGFRHASRSFVVKNCFALSGRIGVEEKRMVVRLAPSPFHVALHISSMDESVESVTWLDGRRLEFQLEGL